MLHEMNLKEKPFKTIKNGSKTVEMRLYDEKRQKIKIGDQIRFNTNFCSETILVEVVNLHICPAFADLYAKFNKVNLGYDENEPASPEDMLDFYPEHEQQKYGVVGIEIKKIGN